MLNNIPKNIGSRVFIITALIFFTALKFFEVTYIHPIIA
ncbi:hypothetical protein BH09BAC6_BH09BAC6_09580 [soil metagenome]